MQEQRAERQRQRGDALELRDPRHRLDVRRVQQEHRAPRQGPRHGQPRRAQQRRQQGRVGRVQEQVDDVVAEGVVGEDLALERRQQQVDGRVVRGVQARRPERIEDRTQILPAESARIRIGDDVPEVVRQEGPMQRRAVDQQRDRREYREQDSGGSRPCGYGAGEPAPPPSLACGSLRASLAVSGTLSGMRGESTKPSRAPSRRSPCAHAASRLRNMGTPARMDS